METISYVTLAAGAPSAASGGVPALYKPRCTPVPITFNLLLPGYTNTDRLKALNLSEEKVKQMVPAGRLADPSELADLATYLASEKGAYITGQSIAIDGGSII